MIDMRSYHGPNSENRRPTLSDESRILGRVQTRWLKSRLLASTATWKVIAADMPLGLVAYHDAGRRIGTDSSRSSGSAPGG
jgi:alkaline phosphatase D